MCHWVLRVWQCGDSFFTKYSSCSFDRAAHGPESLLNPLHPSITPLGLDEVVPMTNADTTCQPVRGVGGNSRNRTGKKNNGKGKSGRKPNASAERGTSNGTASISRPTLPAIDLTSPGSTCTAVTDSGSKAIFPRNAETGQTIPIPLSEIGKASHFGDKMLGLGEKSRCSVFEVVLESKERTMCPAVRFQTPSN